MRRLSGSAVNNFFSSATASGLLAILQVNFGQLQEQRPRLAHHTLLDVQVSKFLERTNLFGGQLGDALVNRDRFGEEPVADEQLRQPFEVIDGLEGFALANIQLADGHQGDLIARLVLQDLLVFGDGLGDLALVQKFLCGFDKLAFVIGHSRKGTASPTKAIRDFLLSGVADAGARNSPFSSYPWVTGSVNESGSHCEQPVIPVADTKRWGE